MAKPYRWGDLPPAAMERIKARRALLQLPPHLSPRRDMAGRRVSAALASPVLRGPQQ